MPQNLILAEIQEFAGFPAGTQRYIRRSIDVAAGQSDTLELWSRNGHEEAAIKLQMRTYARLEDLRKRVPTTPDLEATESFMAPLVSISAFDLGQDRLPTFSSYRFLYERLLGALARPWLPSAFCAAAALPQIQPGKRKYLLQSISEAAATAAGWSKSEPFFFPEWVKKVEQHTEL